MSTAVAAASRFSLPQRFAELLPGVVLLLTIGYSGRLIELSFNAYGKANHLALPNIEYVLWAIAIGLIVLGRPLLNLYGDGFADQGYTVLMILTFAQLTAGLVGALAGYLLTMTAHEKQAAWIIGITAAVNLVLALVLTPRYGPVGTASATLIVAIARAVALRVYIRREMGLRIPAV